MVSMPASPPAQPYSATPPSRASAATIRMLANMNSAPRSGQRRAARGGGGAPAAELAPARLARATREMRRARLSVGQIVVALRVARDEERTREIHTLHQRLLVERQLFRVALAEARAWRAVLAASRAGG